MADHRGRTAYIVVFHFDSNFGLNYKDTPDRRKRTVDKPEWWKQRAKIMRQYVIPALNAQVFQDFTVWGLFMPGYETLAKPVLDLFYQQGFKSSFDGPRPIRETYRNGPNEWLGLIHHDSDDLYGLGAFKQYAGVQPKAGRIAYFHRGYIFGCNDRKLFNFGKKGNTAPPFHMTFYPRWALKNEAYWYGYRRISGVSVDHFRIGALKGRVLLPPGNFCQLIHATNTVTAWKNPNIQKRLDGEIKDERKKRSIMSTFGVTV